LGRVESVIVWYNTGKMTIYLLYNRQTLAERQLQELAKRLEPLQIEAELIDADSPRGAQLTEHYDIMGRPAVLIVSNDGSLRQLWQGEDQVPSPADISYYAHQ
jgi:hypothetical protein